MKVILFMSLSANGYIARKNGEEDFLSHVHWEESVKLAERIGCFIVGRKTYDIVRRLYGKDSNFDTINAKRIVIYNKSSPKPAKGYIFVKSPEEAIKKARELGFKQVLLNGGGTLNGSFMKKGLVDEIIFDIEPFAIGRGIAVFKPDNFERKLRLIKTAKLRNGILQLHYKVLKSSLKQ